MKEKMEEIVKELERILNPPSLDVQKEYSKNKYEYEYLEDARDALIIGGVKDYVECLKRDILFMK